MDVVALAEALLEERAKDQTLDVCKRLLEQAGCRIEQRPEADALVAERGSGGLVLSGHVDVVDPGAGWTQPPFGATRSDERLYGRGASDMRGPIAAMLAAVQETDDPVRLVLTTDEETTMRGIRSLTDAEVFAGAPLVVVGEPTRLNVATVGKGLVWLRVEAEGVQGHASTPRSEEGRGPSGPERLLDAIAPFPASPIELEHPTLGPATAALTGLASEQTAFNVLAGTATARIDCRFPPPVMPDDVVASMERILGLPHEGVYLEVAKKEPAFVGADELADHLLSLLADAGVVAREQGVMFASEAGHWQRVAPTVICGPGSIDRAHAPDEFITIDELEAGKRAYVALIDAFGSERASPSGHRSGEPSDS